MGSYSTAILRRQSRSCRARADGLEIAVDFPTPLHQIVVHLKPEEEPFRQAEIAGEPQVGVGGDISLAQHDLVDAARSYMNRTCQRVLAEFHRLEKLFKQDFAGVGIGKQPAFRFRHVTCAFQSFRGALKARTRNLEVFLVRFRVWTFGPSRNDVIWLHDCIRRRCKAKESLIPRSKRRAKRSPRAAARVVRPAWPGAAVAAVAGRARRSVP